MSILATPGHWRLLTEQEENILTNTMTITKKNAFFIFFFTKIHF